jgi:hypothetical protein
LRLSQTRRGFGECRRIWRRMTDAMCRERYAERRQRQPASRDSLLSEIRNRPNCGQDRHHVNRHQQRFLPQLAESVGALKGAKTLVRRDVRRARWLVIPARTPDSWNRFWLLGQEKPIARRMEFSQYRRTRTRLCFRRAGNGPAFLLLLLLSGGEAFSYLESEWVSPGSAVRASGSGAFE